MAFLRNTSIYCITREEIDTKKRIAFSSVCITTATISSFGAIVQLVNWYKKLRVTRTETRRVPSPTPHVVFSLALADLFTCLGAIAMSILLLIFHPADDIIDGLHIVKASHPNSTSYVWIFHPADDITDLHIVKASRPNSTSYVWIGMPIESFTMFSYITSYLWTLFYSVDICLQVHNQHSRVHSGVYHVMSWPLAALLVACMQYTDYKSNPNLCSSGSATLFHYLVCYIPLLLVMVCLPVIYWKAYKRVSQNIKRTAYFTDVERKMQKSVREKFCAIVFVFLFCWLPNFADGFHDIAAYIANNGNFDYEDTGVNHFGLWMVEASINPLQGILNCLVYGQHRQFASFCSHILNLCHRSTSPPNSSDLEDPNRILSLNSLTAASFKISVSETSPLLAESRRNTPLSATPVSNCSHRQEPFAARLLGEFNR